MVQQEKREMKEQIRPTKPIDTEKRIRLQKETKKNAGVLCPQILKCTRCRIEVE
jgi:hypothetical protein